MSGRTTGHLPGLDIAEAKSWQSYLEGVSCFEAVQARLLSGKHHFAMVDLQILDFLNRSTNGYARMGDLADSLEVQPARLTKRVRRLRAQALVRQEPSPEDKRGVLAVVTDSGREVARQATLTYAHGVRAHLIDPLSRPQVIALEKNCRRISIKPDHTRPGLPTCDLPGLDDTEMSCWRRFVGSSQHLFASVNSTLVTTHHLSLPDVLVLYVLATCDGSARMSVLARTLMLSPSRVTQQISRLESLGGGLVRRTSAPGDMRGVLADITVRGRMRAQPAVETYAQAIRTHYLDRLSRQQMIALGEICRRISTPLKSEGLPAKPKPP
ncbi:MarR family winged helix-turn-helix transcriptional regulator [Mycolicibacterium sp. XJ870]